MTVVVCCRLEMTYSFPLHFMTIFSISSIIIDTILQSQIFQFSFIYVVHKEYKNEPEGCLKSEGYKSHPVGLDETTIHNAGADLEFCKGGCPINLKEAPEVERRKRRDGWDLERGLCTLPQKMEGVI